MKKNKKFPRGKISKKWKWILITNACITLFKNEPTLDLCELYPNGDYKFVPRLFSEALLKDIDINNYYGLYQIEE